MLDVLHALAAAAGAEKGEPGGGIPGEVEALAAYLEIRKTVAVLFNELRQAVEEESAHQLGEGAFFLRICTVVVPPQIICAAIPFFLRRKRHAHAHEGDEPGQGRTIECRAEQLYFCIRTHFRLVSGGVLV